MEHASWEQIAKPLQQYLRSCGLSEETVRTYHGNIATFWRWCARHESDARFVDRPAVRAWVSERLEAVSTSRAHNDVSAIRYLFKWAREDRLRDDDPTDGINVKRKKALPTEPLTWEELDILMSVCAEERDRLLLLVFAYTGMRVGEMANMEAEHIDWRRGTIRVLGKGNKERLIAPNPDILKRLHAYLGMFPSGPVWLSKQRANPLSAHSIRKVLYGIASQAKVQGVHPHRLRAFFATEYIGQFADIQALQGMMGHESIETTARYSYFTRERRGQEQMKRFGAAPARREAG